MTTSLSLRVLPLMLLGLALAGCTTDSPPVSQPSAPVASAVASTAPTTAPAAAQPADGTNVRSCRDGKCEVRVTAKAQVPLPARSGLGPIEVIAIDATSVSMVITLTGADFDSDGGCSPFITGPAAGSPGFVTMSCAKGDRGTVNKVTVEVVDIAAGAAVLRVSSGG